MQVTCGIDWAEGHHDVALVDRGGHRVAKARIDTGVTGLGALLGLIAEHAEDPTGVAVAIETDKNLFVVVLQAAGFTVYPINPQGGGPVSGTARAGRREVRSGRCGGAGQVLPTDRHQHRPLPQISELGLAVKALARQHQEEIWARQLTVNRLRSVLLEFYPNALKAFPVLTHKAALEVLRAAPTPAAAGMLTRRRVVSLLQRSGRGNHPALVEQILGQLRVPAFASAAAGRRRSRSRRGRPGRHHRRDADLDR